MSDTPRKPEEEPDEKTAESPAGQETADQPTVNLKREEAPVEALLEEEPAEYELPDPAPRPAESEDEEDEPGLPTSDPIFPTASPQLKPPGPADVSGFGAPGGAGSDVAPQPAAPVPTEAQRSVDPIAPPTPPTGVSAPVAANTPGVASSPEAQVGRPMPPGPPRQRSSAEIRADIEAGRQELSQSVEVLRDKVDELTDLRGQLRKHRREITIAAAAVGFAVGARFMLRRRR